MPTARAHLSPHVNSSGGVMLYLPPAPNNKESQDRVICRDVLGILERGGVGWANQAQANFLGDAFIEALSALLWVITDMWEILHERCCRPSEFWKKPSS